LTDQELDDLVRNVCEFCKNENAFWLSASVHADCMNIGDGEHVNPIQERECSCNCCYPEEIRN